jgi:acyl carrier protein
MFDGVADQGENYMSIKATVVSQIEQMRDASKKDLAPLTEDLVLLDSGLDSLGMAILVTRLEDTLGLDPFTESGVISPPVTLGEFIQLYENAAKSS